MSDHTLHCWEHGEAQPIGPCPHSGELAADAAPDCLRRCWMGVQFGSSSTCMLEAGHDGDHEFTPDDAIGIAFVGEEAPS